MYLLKTLTHKLYLTTVVLFIVTQLFAQNNYFVKNKGQVFNQNGVFNNDVVYVLSLKDYNVSFYSDHFSYEIFTADKEDSTLLNVERIELWFDDANLNSSIIPTNKVKDVLNVYKNGKSFIDIVSFKNITYKNIWEGVDIEFTIDDYQLKYNYIVSNQTVKSIVLNVKGAEVSQEKDGELILKTTHSSIKETIPSSYFLLSNNVKKEHVVGLRTTKNKIEFLLPKKRENTFVIDPIAYGNEYTSYYGGAHMDFAQSINTTKTNQVIVSGYTVSTNNIATTGAYQSILSDQDAFIVAFDNQGTRLWATYFGGEGGERIYTAAIDSNDNIFIAGNTTSLIGIATAGAHQQYISSGDDAFITKFSASGILVWGSYYGGDNHELITTIEVDDLNKIYVTGHTSSTNVPCTASAFRNSIVGYENAFLGVFENDGTVLYNSYYIKGSSTRGQGIKITQNGTIYFSGYTNDTDTITFSSIHQAQNNGYIEGFLIKLNPQYQMVWKTYIGGDHNDLITAIDLDSLENIYLVGKTKSTIGIATTNAIQSIYSNNWDGFIIKLDSACSQLWGAYIQAGNSEEINVVKTKDTTVWLLGSTNGTNLFTNSASLQENNNGGYDNMIINLSDTGGLIWSSYLGGANDEFGFDLTINQNNKVLIAGQTGSNTNISTVNAHQTNYGGHIYDGFWTKLCQPIYPTILSQSGTINLCEGDSVFLTTTNSFNSYLWSNAETSNSVHISTSGDYVLKTKDVNNCPGRSDTLTINVIPKVNLSVQQSNNAICYNDSVLLSVSGSYNSYLWSNGDTTSSIHVLDSQTYSLTTVNSYGCSYQSDTLQIAIAPYHYLIQVIGDTIICSGGEAILYTNGLNSISWNSLHTTNAITVNNPGSYWFTGTDFFGCSVVSDTVSITQIINNSPSLVLDTTFLFSICWNDSIHLTAEANFDSYLWSNGGVGQTAYLSEEGYYYLSATDTNGCVGISDSIKVEYKTSGVSGTILPQGNEFCEGDSLLLITQPNLTNIEWNLNSQTNDSLYILINGSFYYSAIDSLGCLTLSDTVIALENNLPDVQIIGGVDSICLYDSLYLSSFTNLTTYSWSNGNQSENNNYIFNTLGLNTIHLTGTDLNNCSSNDSITVNTYDCIVYNHISEESIDNISLKTTNFQLLIDSPVEIKRLSLLDLNGRVIFYRDNISSSNLSINIDKVASATYIVQIELTNNKSVIVRKVTFPQ